jgi:hypothetical protein
LASLIAGAILLLIAGGAITVTVVNNNTNNGGSGAAGLDGTKTSKSGTTEAPAARFDPAESGGAAVAENGSRYFFGRDFYVALADIQSLSGGYRVSSITLQEGTLPPCRYTNPSSGRFIYRRSDREYEVTVDLRFSIEAEVNVAEWTGRPQSSPCVGEGSAS